jgi:hypothetical protein
MTMYALKIISLFVCNFTAVLLVIILRSLTLTVWAAQYWTDNWKSWQLAHWLTDSYAHSFTNGTELNTENLQTSGTFIRAAWQHCTENFTSYSLNCPILQWTGSRKNLSVTFVGMSPIRKFLPYSQAASAFVISWAIYSFCGYCHQYHICCTWYSVSNNNLWINWCWI